MKIQKKQYHPDPAPGGGESGGGTPASTDAAPAAVSAAAPAAAPADKPVEVQLSPMEAFKAAKPIGEIVEKIPEKFGIDELNKGGLKDIIKADPAKPADATEKKPDETKAPIVEKKDGDEFKLTLEEEATAAKEQNDGESSWKLVAENLPDMPGLEEDTFDAFKKADEVRIAKVKTEALQEGQKLALDKLPTQARELFDYLSVEGNTIETFMQPLAVIDKYLSLDQETLVTEDYKARGFSEEEAKEAVDNLKLDGGLKIKALEIQKTLQSLRQEKQQSLVASARQKIDADRTAKVERETKELNQFTESLSKVKDWHSAPIDDRAKQVITKRFQDGVYRARLADDPQTAVDVALYLEFKDQLKSIYGRELIDQGRSQILDKLHNVGIPGAQSSKSDISQKSELEGFDAWEQRLKEEDAKRKSGVD